MNLSKQINSLQSASTDDLNKLLHAVQCELKKRKDPAKLASFTEFLPDFCPDTDLLDAVWEDCLSLDLADNTRKASTQWLCATGQPYVYPDDSPVHEAKDIHSYPNISKLLHLVNESSAVTGPLDSCLVLKYCSDKTKQSLHSDNEPLIDQSKSICAFSLGSVRTLEFFGNGNGKGSKWVNSYNMTHNSMVVMRPGAQQYLRHAVRPRNSSSSSSENTSQLRFCLSFRAVSKVSEDFTTPPTSPSVSTVPGNSVPSPLPPPGTGTDTPTILPVFKPVCLVVGDSFAARLDPIKLGKKKFAVVNLARGGSKISRTINQLEQYASDHEDSIHSVKKIAVSVGTNDLRNLEDPNSLRGPLKRLCEKISTLYPEARVWFQSLLPLPIKNCNDSKTNERVRHVNRIIFNECVYRRFYYIDAFYQFIKFNRKWNEPFTRFDKLFENNGIHPNPERGMGVLARLYIRALHCKFFNPRVFQ